MNHNILATQFLATLVLLFTFNSVNAAPPTTLKGISASTLDQSAHVGDTGNLHNVTAAHDGYGVTRLIRFNAKQS